MDPIASPSFCCEVVFSATGEKQSGTQQLPVRYQGSDLQVAMMLSDGLEVFRPGLPVRVSLQMSRPGGEAVTQQDLSASGELVLVAQGTTVSYQKRPDAVRISLAASSFDSTGAQVVEIPMTKEDVSCCDPTASRRTWKEHEEACGCCVTYMSFYVERKLPGDTYFQRIYSAPESKVAASCRESPSGFFHASFSSPPLVKKLSASFLNMSLLMIFLTFCSLRLNLKDPPTFNGVNVHFFVMGKGSSLLIRILLFSQNSDLLVVLSNGSPFTILSIDATIYPGNLAYLNGYFPTGVKVNGIGTDLFDHSPIENGHSIDFISDHPTARKTDLENAWKIRHEFIHVTAERVASDELEFAVQQIRDFSSDVYCAKIIDARAKRIDSSAAILQQSLSGIPHIAISEQIECLIPIFLENHWCGIELSCCNNVWKIVLVGVPQAFHESFLWITRGAVSFPGATIHAFVAPVVSFPGLCGWVIVKRWFQKVGLLDSFVSRFGHVETTDLIVGPFESTFRANGGCQTVKRICSFAIICRSAFLAFLATKDSANLIDMRMPLFGGADEDEQMQEVVPPKSKAVQSNSSDPWSRFDPWMSRSQKQCKWEDLKLARDHPFVDKDGRSLGQVHKPQLNANTGGIAFATRAAAADLVKVIPSEPAAILVPASDKPLHPSINASQVSGPFEVVVEDASTGSIYKRQTILIQIKPFVKYQLASPVYNAKLDLIKEVVLEIDSRLYKGLFDRPLDVFKRLIDDQFPHEVFQGVNIYGYRKFQPTANDQGHIVHQVMCKLPLPKRSAAIERSLLGSIAVRDFIPKGERCDETSVVPKFWPVDKASRDAALKATSGLEGFAGLIVSKRGLAVRCWAGKIGILRKALLPEDDRLCQININVAPKIVKDSTGWPLAISPGEVIKATFHAVKLAPVPTRCFRVLGVTC
eukprot:symbB.v1.2.014234.t1/scaffold1017.1/size232338/3